MRDEEWRPLFGQTNQSQSHLRNQGVTSGDLFLFFGWFQEVEKYGDSYRYKHGSLDKHVLWGWLQIDKVFQVDDVASKSELTWARYHPHFYHKPNPLNTLYTATRCLSLGEASHQQVCGGGVFRKFSDHLQLTKRGSPKRSLWSIPEWMLPPSSDKALSYHPDMNRWTRDNEGNPQLQTTGRGQEFVLDARYYPEATSWVASLFRSE